MVEGKERRHADLPKTSRGGYIILPWRCYASLSSHLRINGSVRLPQACTRPLFHNYNFLPQLSPLTALIS